MGNRILVVDDTPKNIQVLGNLLRQNAYEVDFALNGKSALQWVDKKSFDLILLDVMMPEMNGFEVCEVIRMEKKICEIPIIFLTAKTDAESILNGFKSGGQDFITKPFNSEELLARVKTHVELKESREKLSDINALLKDKVQERTQQLSDANKKLTELYEQLQSIDTEKAKFLNLISHEIRTPLNGIIGFLDIIKDINVDPQILEFFTYIDQSVYRLERFSVSALLITQLRTKSNFKPIEISINSVISKLIQTKNKKLTDKSQRITVELPSKDVRILGDEYLLKKCFESIYENAIHYSQSGTELKIKLQRHKTKIDIQFIDEGPGFSDLALKNKFKLFFTDTEEADNHIGLDLALSKAIIDLHKGDIQIWNNDENGATVQLSFACFNAENICSQ